MNLFEKHMSVTTGWTIGKLYIELQNSWLKSVDEQLK